MAKRATSFMPALPAPAPATPAYRWLYAAVRAEILEGRLRPGSRLPASRDLSRQYGLSRGTVVAAFEQLKAEGYLEGSVGSGTYVSRVLPEERLQISAGGKAAGSRPGRVVSTPLSRYAQRIHAFSVLENRPSRAFRPNLPALTAFPIALWTQLTARRLRRASTNLLLGCEPMGYAPLQAAIADYLRSSRGVNCTPQQVAIVSGVQEALDLVARLLLEPGTQVCMENPGYIGAASVFEALGAQIATAPVDDEGMELPAASLRGARLIYVTPGHQFPLGVTMTLRRRLALLDWARSARALIFEDDYDSEYRYSGRPVPALQGLDREGLVLLAGSFSKVLFPSLRLGYLVLPPHLVEPFADAKSIISRHPPLLEQAVLCDFITEGHFGRHLRRMRELYAERRGILLECAAQHLGGLLEVSGVEAGLQTAGWLGAGLDAEAAASAAAQRGVEVTPLSRYSRGPLVRQGLQLGFAAVDAAEIRRGVKDLAIALEAEVALQRNSQRPAKRRHRSKAGPAPGR